MPYANAAELKGKPVVGSRHCVALVQHYAGAPVTANWREGEAVVGNATIISPVRARKAAFVPSLSGICVRGRFCQGLVNRVGEPFSEPDRTLLGPCAAPLVWRENRFICQI